MVQLGILRLIGRLETYLSRTTRRSHSISATTQLAATLQFLATGSFQTVVASCHGISQPLLSRCICNVSNTLCSCSSDFIRFPNEVGQRRMQQGFQHKFEFPKVLGCIDGSHIPIVAPSINEPLYVNRKGYHSINVQAICDDNSRFIDAVVKWPGCTHDAYMWRQSGIKQGISSGEIQTVDGWFLGDSGNNFCIDHGLHTDIDIAENEFPIDFDEDHSVHGNMLRQQIVHISVRDFLSVLYLMCCNSILD